MPLEESLATAQGDSSNKKRIQIEDLIRHVLLLCGAEAPQRRAPRERRRWRWHIKRAVAKTAEKMKGQACVSAPPRTRSERESELITSLFNVTRKFDELIGSLFLVCSCLAACESGLPSDCTHEGFWFQIPDCCALVCCTCWKILCLNADRHKLFFCLSTAHVAMVVERKLQERNMARVMAMG